MKHYYSFVCILMMASFCLYAECAKQTRLTGLVQLIANRLDMESVDRQQDMINLLDRLNYLELRLNESSDNFQCSNSGQPGNDPSPTRETGATANNVNLMRIMQAFKEEKKIIQTLQRQVPAINKKLNSFDEILGDLTNVVEATRGEMCTPADLEPVSIIASCPDLESLASRQDLESLASRQDFDILATRIDVESIARQNDTSNLLNKLNVLEIRMNNAVDHFDCSKTCQPESGATSITDLNDQLTKLSDAVQTLSVKIDEIADTSDRSGKTTPTTTTDMTENTVKSTSPTIGKMDSCLSHYKEGRKDNGVYTVYPLEDSTPVKVFCDMTTDGGGWTVFQRREDGSVDFYRDWQAYKQGFGTLTGELWLGNDNIAALTSTGGHELRVDLEDFDGVRKYAKYGTFKVSPASDKYRLEVNRYSGTAGDSLEYHNGSKFSTKDMDNDRSSGDCALYNKGAWWYNVCGFSNLNGLYTRHIRGVYWHHWRGIYYSLMMTEMKLR